MSMQTTIFTKDGLPSTQLLLLNNGVVDLRSFAIAHQEEMYIIIW